MTRVGPGELAAFNDLLNDAFSYDNNNTRGLYARPQRIVLPNGFSGDVVLKVHGSRKPGVLVMAGIVRSQDGEVFGERHSFRGGPRPARHTHDSLGCSGFRYAEGSFTPDETLGEDALALGTNRQERCYDLASRMVRSLVETGPADSIFFDQDRDALGRAEEMLGQGYVEDLLVDGTLRQALSHRLALRG